MDTSIIQVYVSLTVEQNEPHQLASKVIDLIINSACKDILNLGTPLFFLCDRLISIVQLYKVQNAQFYLLSQTHFGGNFSVTNTALGKRDGWRVDENLQIQFLPLWSTLSVKKSYLQINNYKMAG